MDKKIDEDLGGTTPLNIILKFPVKQKQDEDDEFEEWEDEGVAEDPSWRPGGLTDCPLLYTATARKED